MRLLSPLAATALALSTIAGAYWAVAIVDDSPWDRVAIAQIDELDGAVVDRPALDFELMDLEGRPHRLSELRGSVVLLNFWASWCPPCIEELPSMLALSRQMRGRPFVIVAVSADEDGAALRDALTTAGFGPDDALVLRDPTSETANAYGTRLLPESYVVDRRGVVVARMAGARDWNADAAQRLIERLMRAEWKAP
ncbi:MAG: TlpA family protein disulfide reductase [Myxococcales bacterium]|nr:TlpA family protein disulfide reductase [Myxococcales bacterium]